MNTVEEPMYEWNAIPWKKVERAVFKLQKRIYQASVRGDVKTVHKLQKLLMKSWGANLIAVRRVTQDNQGKKTAGIDGLKSLVPKQRLELALKLKQNPFKTKAEAVRRVWIPKPGTKDEKRGLGIPVMEDRARQTLAKLALEAEWEAKFEPNSYGFRPGRSCHDAIGAIFDNISRKAKYVLDADIAKCFDKINHQALLNKLQTFPKLRQVIRGWLVAGVMEGSELYPSTEGCPQGGAISPLLMNIALHGLETALVKKFARRQYPDWNRKKLAVVRFADDFVVLDEDEKTIQEAKEFTQGWLSDMGLELKPSKTKITHTWKQYNGNKGFDFLGFEIRQYSVSKKRSSRNPRGQILGFKTIIQPSKEGIRRHLVAMREIILKHNSAPQAALIQHLNLVIKGWSKYYSTVASKKQFNRTDFILYQKLRAWAYRRHKNKGKRWIATKYWHPQKGKWQFSSGKTLLYKHSATPIKRHIKVIGSKSPFDGDWIYWSTRMGRHPETPKRLAYLLKKQKGKCSYCELSFRNEDLMEQDHIIPKIQGGKDEITNLQILHKHCHDSKTTKDIRSYAKRC